MIRRPIILLIALLLNSCSYLTIGPDYESPDLKLPGEFATATEKLEAERSKIPSTEWWQAFGDKDLNELIVRGTNNNLSMKRAFERLSLARANANLSLQGLFPRLDIFTEYQKVKSPTFRFPGANKSSFSYQQYTLGGQASWEIDIFGKLRRIYESQAETENEQLFLTADALRILQADLASYYIQLRNAQAQRKIAESNLAKQKEVLNLIKQKLDVGDSSPIDFERSNALTSSTQALIPQYHAAENAALYRIATLIGDYANALPENLKTEAKIPKYVGPATIGSPSDVIKRRPDIRAAEADARASNALVGASIANLFPIVNFTGSLSEQGRSSKDWFSAGSRAYSLTPQISWSILNLGSIIQDIKGSRAKAREGLLAYQESILKALEEVEAALSQVDSELQRKISLKSAFKSAKKVGQLAQEQFNEGLIDSLELIEAQQTALQSQSQLRDSEAQLALSYVRLFKALGGGWEEEKNAPEEEKLTKE